MHKWPIQLLIGEVLLVTLLLVGAVGLPAEFLDLQITLLSVVACTLVVIPFQGFLPKEQLKARWWLVGLLMAEVLLITPVLIAAQVMPGDLLLLQGFLLLVAGCLIVSTPILTFIAEGILYDTSERTLAEFGPELESRGELEQLTQLKQAGLLDRLAAHIRDSTARAARHFRGRRPVPEAPSTEPGSLDRLVGLKRHGVWVPPPMSDNGGTS